MRPPSLVMGLLALLAGGCGGRDAGTAQALQTFERFQDAVFARDAAAARRLVTSESAPVVDEIPWDAVTRKPRLLAVDATDERGSFRVAVQDPQKPAGQLDAYVVVRERGRFVVDLIATAGLYARTFQTAGDLRQDLELGELSPADHERLRRMELEKPRDRR